MNKNFWKNKKVLITGHEGFVGSNLVKALSGSAERIIGCDKVLNRKRSVLDGFRSGIKAIKLDISDFKRINSVIKNERPDIVFHLAAEAIIGRAKADPLNVFRSNIEGTWNVLEACRPEKNIEAILVASSDKAYGTADRLPYNEDMKLLGRHPYDVSKSCADMLAQSYYHSFNLPICIMRCGNIYGPGDFNFSRIIPDAVTSALSGKQFVVRSNGKYTRDYIYVMDAVNGYIMAAENMKKKGLYGKVYNMSPERPLGVIEVLKKIEKAFGNKLKPPKILGKARDEIQDQYLDSGRIRRDIGWKPLVSFEQGIVQAIEWYSK